MRNHKFSLVTALLLLLLVAAVVNIFLVYRAYDNAIVSMAHSPPGQPLPDLSATTSEPRTTIGPVVTSSQALLPNWYGDVFLTKADTGYDIVVEAFRSGSRDYVSADTVEADVRHPGASVSEITPVFTKTSTGKFTAHVEFPSGGTWEVHVRIHRDYQTLEFAEKFTLN